MTHETIALIAYLIFAVALIAAVMGPLWYITRPTPRAPNLFEATISLQHALAVERVARAAFAAGTLPEAAYHGVCDLVRAAEAAQSAAAQRTLDKYARKFEGAS